jgi:AGZA family xanthine/uracil permease-like MFS transporter
VGVQFIKSTIGALTFKSISKGSFWEVLFIFLYVDILDTAGTLYSTARSVGFLSIDILDTTGTFYLMVRFARLLDINRDFESQYFALIADA